MIATTDMKKLSKKSLKFQQEKDKEKVKGIFHYYEVPGGSLSFSFKKYKGEKVERYDLIDGVIYTIPLGVAKHLNTSGSYPVHKHLKDESGNVSQRIGQKVNRYGFQSLQFMDIEDLPEREAVDKIVTIERV